MKQLLSGLFIFGLAFSTCIPVPGQNPGTAVSENNRDTIHYIVGGYRHGISFFPMVKLSSVEYVAGEDLSFDRFHSNDVINHWMKKWAEQYPALVTLYEVGRSYEGRPIMQLTITNKKTGSDLIKPAAFFEGNRHSGEVTSAESVLWLIQHLLANYGSDPEITGMIDRYAIYLKPVNNPDGNNLYMNTAQSNRSTVRPDDSDNDGLLDEDPPEDLDGDGVILTLRWKDEKNGTFIPDPADTTGRIMKRVPRGEGIYSTSSEGIDNDGDGRINEDGIGGLDLHRNYPENWRPETELTERGFTQNGAGEYPLSETETRTVFSFLMTHPNIYIVNSMDTRVPMHLRPPSTSPSEERMYPEDLKWYILFDKLGKSITGYEKAGDVYNDYGNGEPIFGHGPDFGYWYYGAIWYGDELWNGARNKDYDGDGDIDQVDILAWDDLENDGIGFTEWKPIKHPEHPDAEVGGFDPKFFSQNAPAKHLEEWASKEARFNLAMMKYLPMVEWESIDIKKGKNLKSDSTDFEIIVKFRNTGKLPTALRQAHLVKIVREDEVRLEFDTKEGEKPAYRMLDIKPSGRNGGGMMMYDEERTAGRPVSKSVGYTDGGAVNEAVFRIRVLNNAVIRGTASILTTRAGILKDREFIIR
ncbi:MAG TPA: M14 family metallopeptidase [Bacteroidales bacterium]|nr:M14 family metallopeptidase [Bacteroidales bacterium]